VRRINSGLSGRGHSIERARAGCWKVLEGSNCDKNGETALQNLVYYLFLNLLPSFFFFPYSSCVSVGISSF
jgi:hypothetical protein